MGLRLAIARRYIPGVIKKHYLQQLFHIIAESFETAAPSLKSLSFADGLRQFAVYSQTCAERAIQSAQELQPIKDRLFDKAYWLGQNIRKQFGVKTRWDVAAAAQIVYRVLGIEFRYDFQGEAVFTICFFSRYYSREVCGVISALDAGVLAGLSGGVQLSFTQRITEGNDCCRANFDL